MPAAPSQLSNLFSICRLTQRPTVSFDTVCGLPSKRKASSVKQAPKKSPKGRSQSSNTIKESKLKKGCIFVAEDEDGSVLFNFKPDLGSEPLSNHLTVLSPGQQHLTKVKLRKVASGSSKGQLTFQLWDTATDSSAVSTTTKASATTGESLQKPDAVASQHEAGNQERVPDSQATQRPVSTSDALSLLLGIAPSHFDSHWQPDTAPQYAFAATRDSSQASPSSAQQPTLLQKPLVRPTPVPKPDAQEPAEPQKPAPRPALLRKPVRPPVSENPPAVPSQDVAGSRSQHDKNSEKWVPCYLWHESGLPKKRNLKDFPYEFIGGDSDDAVSTSDEPESAGSDSQAQELEVAPANAVQKAWRPIQQLLLRIWRLLPYWIRSRFHNQQRQEPAVHASRILSQHMLASARDEAVEGSTWDVSTGRSLTPLADVERYQIEDLIKMGVKDLELYRTALTSPSALPLEKIVAASFDRLEFLGDAVVNLAFRSWVYARFPEDDEGSMTNTANTLVSNRAHVLYANSINLTSHIAQNLRFVRPNCRINEEVLADAFEALVGAIYLDRGLQAASKFIIALAEEVMGLEQDLSSYRNYKLYLVNSVNQKELGRVTYQSKKRQRDMWQSKCRLQGKLVGIGLDKQRKQAESAAAFAAMEELGFNELMTDPVGYRPSRHADRKPYLRPPPEASDAPASASKDQLPKEQLLKDQPPREQLLRDQPLREQLPKDQQGSDQPGKGQLSVEQPSQDQLSKDKSSREQLNKSQVSRERLMKGRVHKDQLSRSQMAKQQLSKDQGDKDKPSANQTEAS